MSIRTVKATRYVTPLREGGSLPAIVEADDDGMYVLKFRGAGHGDSTGTSTFHGFHGADYFALEWGDQLFWRVDWILTRESATRRIQATTCTIVRDAKPPIYPSDHWPVVTEMLLLLPD